MVAVGCLLVFLSGLDASAQDALRGFVLEAGDATAAIVRAWRGHVEVTGIGPSTPATTAPTWPAGCRLVRSRASRDGGRLLLDLPDADRRCRPTWSLALPATVSLRIEVEDREGSVNASRASLRVTGGVGDVDISSALGPVDVTRRVGSLRIVSSAPRHGHASAEARVGKAIRRVRGHAIATRKHPGSWNRLTLPGSGTIRITAAVDVGSADVDCAEPGRCP